MRHTQCSKSSPSIAHRIIHLTGWLVSVKLPQVTHTTSNIQVASQRLHTMQGSVIGHVCQVGGSLLWVIQECGGQTLKLTVETTRNKDAFIYRSGSMATKSLM